MGLEVLFLLLPVAALSGWWIGRRPSHHLPPQEPFSKNYFLGLNYLVNEQPDKAIEVLIRMLEIDNETIETHFALGSLFRRRGEVDRAIRIHQNLIARPTLSRQQRNQALYELGKDYMGAGLLDRAENIFRELANEGGYAAKALRQLLEIYQQEREWEGAISTARRLQTVSGDEVGTQVAHYCCEQAEVAMQKGDLQRCLVQAQQALREDEQCVRASMIEGRTLLALGRTEEAAQSFERIEAQGAEFLAEVVESLFLCYERLGKGPQRLQVAQEMVRRHSHTALALAVTALIRRHFGDAAAVDTMTEFLAHSPTIWGVDLLLELKASAAGDALTNNDYQLLKSVTGRLLQGRPRYRCERCGFSGKSLYWQCPGCKQWNTVKPHLDGDLHPPL